MNGIIEVICSIGFAGLGALLVVVATILLSARMHKAATACAIIAIVCIVSHLHLNADGTKKIINRLSPKSAPEKPPVIPLE
jgi:hypothetical protein